MCDLVKTKNCTYKSPNIIADYDKGKKLFTAEYIFIKEKVRENIVSRLSPATRGDIQKKSMKERDKLRNLSDMVK